MEKELSRSQVAVLGIATIILGAAFAVQAPANKGFEGLMAIAGISLIGLGISLTTTAALSSPNILATESEA